MNRDEWIQQVRAILDADSRVDAGWLFGSRVSGRPHPWSDTDLAVALAPHVPAIDRLRIQLELGARLPAPADGSDLDLVILDDAGPALAVAVLGGGDLIFCRSEDRVRDLTFSAYQVYWDLAPIRAAMLQAMTARMREGTFGRL